MNKKLKTIFMGTPDFAVPGLQSLLASSDFEVMAVYTQPDKSAGRKHILTPPPVKKIALEKNILVFQPEKIKTAMENISSLQPDLIVVIAYGKIIPQAILDLPKYGCVNVHASLLPKYRGASCLQAAIKNGDKKTGVTIMKMDAGLDTGPILTQLEITLSGKENLEEIHDKLSKLGADNLVSTLIDYCNNKIIAQTQDESKASYVGLITKEDGFLNPQNSAEEIERQIRAYNPWPGTYLILDNQEKMKIIEAEVFEAANSQLVGSFYIENNQLYLTCGQNSLHILKLQRENRNALSASDFLKGNKDIVKFKAT
ncbi:MAG: methionyl-tRNA formyltransferase [Patescibacteria group bacterium]|nr:methionyl-tRNA formyltransferase [Patescibacteria group bacterium]